MNGRYAHEKIPLFIIREIQTETQMTLYLLDWLRLKRPAIPDVGEGMKE